jgi:hypothetical protein
MRGQKLVNFQSDGSLCGNHTLPLDRTSSCYQPKEESALLKPGFVRFDLGTEYCYLNVTHCSVRRESNPVREITRAENLKLFIRTRDLQKQILHILSPE